MTENGWPACGPDMLDRSPVPGTNIVIPLQKGIPSIILKAFAADFHAYAESLYNARGGTDEGGWTATNSVPTSNHLGGTAVDLNWSDHPLHVSYGGYSAAERKVVEELVGLKGGNGGWYEGMVFWGQYWRSPIDPMHFQMGYNTYNNIAKCQDFIKRKIRADGFSVFRRGGTGGGTGAPVVVQPEYWAQRGSTGDHIKRLQQFLNDPLGAKLTVDGIYGERTMWAVQAFQRAKGIDADGIVGPITLRFLTERGFTPDPTAAVPTPAPRWPQTASDRELWEYCAEQLGPGHPTWKSKGMTMRDKVWSLGDGPSDA